jgi:hypothetical protein
VTTKNIYSEGGNIEETFHTKLSNLTLHSKIILRLEGYLSMFLQKISTKSPLFASLRVFKPFASGGTDSTGHAVVVEILPRAKSVRSREIIKFAGLLLLIPIFKQSGDRS